MLKKFAKILVWYLIVPTRLKYLMDFRWHNLSLASHRTARVVLGVAPVLGSNIQIGRRTSIVGYSKAQLILDDDVWIGDDCEIGVQGVIKIGQGASLQHRSQLHGDVDVGAGCVCAANLYISSTEHRFRDTPYLPIRMQDKNAHSHASNEFSRPVVLEEDCWVGINVVICPGVTVGRGAVVGANAVVKTDIPPYCVAAGVPAKVVGKRMDFAPPRILRADNQENTPYFYAGFEMPDIGQSWNSVENNGRWVKQKFALAVQVRWGDILQLEVMVDRDIKLNHDDQMFSLSVGKKTISMIAKPDSRGLLWFSLNDWSLGCLAVLSVCVADAIHIESDCQQ